jgi:hypothetical protein
MIGMKLLVILVSTAFLATGARIARQVNHTPLICGAGHSTVAVPFQYLNPLYPTTTIKSHNFPANYGNNEVCTIEFHAGDETMMLAVYFKQFSLEQSADCTKDSFCMDGKTYCKPDLVGQTFLFKVLAHKKFTLVFNSDNSGTSNGFEIEYNIFPQDPAYLPENNDLCAAK